MKKSHIIAICIIAVAIGIILSTFSDSSTYATFSEISEEPDRNFQVVGKLNPDKPMVYNPEVNVNLFSFFMKDREGTEKQVLFHGSKPQDFERSEQIVIKGKMNGDVFDANEILMKCPSKYNDGKEGMKEFRADTSQSR